MRTVAAWLSTALLLSLTNFAHAAIINSHFEGSVTTFGVSPIFPTTARINDIVFPDTRAVAEFDISGQSTASQVFIEFQVDATISFNETVLADFRAADGILSGADHSSVGSFDSSFIALVPPGPASPAQLISLDVTAAFNSMVGSTNFFGALFDVTDFNSPETTADLFLSSMTLRVENQAPPPPPPGAAPEPSIIALFGVGLLGLGFARRSRRQS